LRHFAVLAVTLAACIALLGACGKRVENDGARALDENCEAYLKEFRTCFGRLTPQSAAIAQAREDHARAALLRISDAKEIVKTCTAGLAQLRASCQ